MLSNLNFRVRDLDNQRLCLLVQTCDFFGSTVVLKEKKKKEEEE